MYYITKAMVERNANTAKKTAYINDNLHKFVWGMFPDGLQKMPSVIYRIKNKVHKNSLAIYVVSSIPTKRTEDFFSSFQIKEFNPSFVDGIYLRFDLLANPVISMPRSNRRTAILDQEKQIEWIKKQGVNNGFSIKELAIGPYEKKMIKKGSKAFPVFSVPFSGILRVEDSVKFKNAVENGIGREKAYGMGMLMVSKI